MAIALCLTAAPSALATTAPATATPVTLTPAVVGLVVARDLVAYAQAEVGTGPAVVPAGPELLAETRTLRTLVAERTPAALPAADLAVAYVTSGGGSAGDLLDAARTLHTAVRSWFTLPAGTTTEQLAAWADEIAAYARADAAGSTPPATPAVADMLDRSALMVAYANGGGGLDGIDGISLDGAEPLLTDAENIALYLADTAVDTALGLLDTDPAEAVQTADALADGFLQIGLTAYAATDASGFGSRTMRRGDTGADVKELQIRVAGWYNNCSGVACKTWFGLDGDFGAMTERAVKNFQAAYGLKRDGVAGPKTNAALRALEDGDGTTKHFTYAEFHEKAGECSNAESTGTFKQGSVNESTVKENVRRVMWRLEAVRHKMKDAYPMTVTSGFRSEAKQKCLREKYGRTAAEPGTSQHNYGTARDGYLTKFSRGRERGLAKTSEFHGIICYGNGDTHNHIDIRLDNTAYRQSWTWPATDSHGRDKALGGGLCTGEEGSPPSTGIVEVGEGPALLGGPGGAVGLDGSLGDVSAPKNEVVGEATGPATTVTPEDLLWIDDSEYVWDVVGGVCDCG